jgi:CBS domain-containing protein
METRLDTILKRKGHAIHSVRPGSTVRQAVELMNAERIGGVLVVDEDDTLVGVFSERDILSRVVQAGRDIDTTLLAEVMTKKIATVQVSITVQEAMAVMTKRRCRHLPVFDGDRLIGVVSIGDLTCWIVDDKNYLIDQLVSFVTDRYPR